MTLSSQSFYRAFEERYRGSRELIKSRLTVYLPFILPLKQFYGTCQGVDLGCGRGEWLELMQENAIEVQGVDLDQSMLEAAHERGLNVRRGEAIQYLQSLASESQVLVSGFHIAEHLQFESLQTVIQESLRVLKPGGLLILETPNPENINVGTVNFYLDPTHQRPIPSLLLSFMAEHGGFEKVKTLGLQEPAGLAENNALTLLSVLNGVSPDYAVVAQKACTKEIADVTAPAFEAEYGLALETLANNYDKQIKAKAQHAETIAQQAESKAHHAETVAQQAEAKAHHAETIAQQAEAKAHHAEAVAHQAEAKAHHAEAKAHHAEAVAQQAEAKAAEQEQRANAAEARVIAILSSTSWRITQPYRMVGKVVKKVFLLPGAARSKTKEKIRLLLVHAKLYINRRPILKKFALAVFRQFPGLFKRMMQATNAQRPASTAHHAVMAEPAHADMELEYLPPRARKIYEGLKTAMVDRSKEHSK